MTADRKNKLLTQSRAVGASRAQPAPSFEKLTGLPKRAPEGATGFVKENVADHLIWIRSGQAGLIVNGDLQVLHFRGDTSPYLRPTAVGTAFHLLNLLRKELVPELRQAFNRARRTQKNVKKDGVRLKRSGDVQFVDMEVQPLQSCRRGEQYFLIFFKESRDPALQPKQTGDEHPRKKGRDRELLELENDLARTRDYLHAMVRDQEIANDLMKANEEIQAGYEKPVHLNNKLTFADVDMPIVILWPDLRVRRFTPQAEQLLHLMPEDIGRPISHTRMEAGFPGLMESISQAAELKQGACREIEAEDGRWYSVRIRPLPTARNEPGGVLVALVDVDDLKRNHLKSEREHKLRRAILNAATNLLVVVSDREGSVLEMNRAAQELMGYSLEELKGRSLWDHLPVPEERTFVRSAFEEAIIAGAAHRENHWRTRRGNPRLIAWSGTVSRNDDGAVDFVICTGVDVTEREIAQEKALRLQEAGNKELARELHDDLCQKLAALGMEVSTILRPSGKSSDTLPERVHALSARINRMANDVHAMSRRLHPAILDELGLEAALKEECVSFSAQTGISAQFESRGPAAVSGDASLCLYRVAQESLRNIAKHAQATKVRVIVSGKKDGIALRVEDTGDGFDVNEIRGQGGLGLISMEERVRLVNGSFSVQSQPGKGTAVEVFIPQPPR